MIQQLSVNTRRRLPVPLDAAIWAGRPLAVAARSLCGNECWEHGDGT
jgi:hypothetical protein